MGIDTNFYVGAYISLDVDVVERRMERRCCPKHKLPIYDGSMFCKECGSMIEMMMIDFRYSGKPVLEDILPSDVCDKEVLCEVLDEWLDDPIQNRMILVYNMSSPTGIRFDDCFDIDREFIDKAIRNLEQIASKEIALLRNSKFVKGLEVKFGAFKCNWYLF